MYNLLIGIIHILANIILSTRLYISIVFLLRYFKILTTGTSRPIWKEEEFLFLYFRILLPILY